MLAKFRFLSAVTGIEVFSLTRSLTSICLVANLVLVLANRRCSSLCIIGLGLQEEVRIIFNLSEVLGCCLRHGAIIRVLRTDKTDAAAVEHCVING